MSLFLSGKIERWGIKDRKFMEMNRDMLLKDFGFVKQYMLKEETEQLEKIWLVH